MNEWPEKTGMTKREKTTARPVAGVVSMPGAPLKSAERRAVKIAGNFLREGRKQTVQTVRRRVLVRRILVRASSPAPAVTSSSRT